MIGVGISFLMMGSVPYWTRKLGGEMNPVAALIYRRMFLSGLMVSLLCVVALFTPSPFNMIIPVLPVMVLAIWTLTLIKRLSNGEVNL